MSKFVVDLSRRKESKMNTIILLKERNEFGETTLSMLMASEGQTPRKVCDIDPYIDIEELKIRLVLDDCHSDVTIVDKTIDGER